MVESPFKELLLERMLLTSVDLFSLTRIGRGRLPSQSYFPRREQSLMDWMSTELSTLEMMV